MRRIQVLGRGQEEIHDDFQRYIEREKAKGTEIPCFTILIGLTNVVFKDAWHMGKFYRLTQFTPVR